MFVTRSGHTLYARNVDRVDWRILAELQADARLSFNEMARRINLSAPATAERVRRLQDAGIITGYRAHVDPAKAGRPVRAFVRMQCYGPTCVLRDPAVPNWPEVLQMQRVTGADCTVLMVAVSDMPALQEFLDRMADYGRPESSLILDDVLAWTPLTPLDPVPPDRAADR